MYYAYLAFILVFVVKTKFQFKVLLNKQMEFHFIVARKHFITIKKIEKFPLNGPRKKNS